MSLRALAGDSAPEFIETLFSTIGPEQLFTCGGRSLDPEEIRYKEANGVSDFTVAQIESDPEAVADAIRVKGLHNLYIHIDFDVLDPQEFTLTPLAEPGGMLKSSLLRLLRAIAKGGNIVGFGFLEYSGREEDKGDPFLEELIAFGRDALAKDTRLESGVPG